MKESRRICIYWIFCTAWSLERYFYNQHGEFIEQ